MFEKKDIWELVKTRFINLEQDTKNRVKFPYDSSIIFEVEYLVKKEIANNLIACFSIRDIEDRIVFSTSKQDENNVVDSSVGRHVYRFVLPNLKLLPGTYRVAGEFWNNEAGLHFKFASIRRLIITSSDYHGDGVYYLPYKTMQDEYTLEQRDENGTLDEIREKLL